MIMVYLSFSLFTCLRVYAMWGCDWKPMLVVAPLALAKPILYMVSNAISQDDGLAKDALVSRVDFDTSQTGGCPDRMRTALG